MRSEVPSTETAARGHRWIHLLAIAVWLGTIVWGMGILLRFASTPGDPGHPPLQWPEGSRIPAAHRPALLMAIHPRCPCTRASIEELQQVMARCRGQMEVHLIVVVPSAVSVSWLDTELEREATAIPGVNTYIDRGGIEARRFGTATSGHTLVYNASGHLAFSGGITLARGHAGDNSGQDAVVEAIREGGPAHATHSVYGCPLHDPPPGARASESYR